MGEKGEVLKAVVYRQFAPPDVSGQRRNHLEPHYVMTLVPRK